MGFSNGGYKLLSAGVSDERFFFFLAPGREGLQSMSMHHYRSSRPARSVDSWHSRLVLGL